jgi:LysM repeat protein
VAIATVASASVVSNPQPSATLIKTTDKKQKTDDTSAVKKVTKATAKPSSKGKPTKYHVIKSGESINTVVKKYNVKVETLLKNNKSLKNAYAVLRPGQRIVIETSSS